MGSVGGSQKPILLPAQTTIIAPSIILAARSVIALVTILTAAARNFLALKTILGVGNVLPALAVLGGFLNDSRPKQVLR